MQASESNIYYFIIIIIIIIIICDIKCLFWIANLYAFCY